MTHAASDTRDVEAPVIIAGGGMVGLSAATFLAHQGIPSLCIEKLPASSPLPRAAFFHMRTLEMFRAVGIEDRVRERSVHEFVPEGAIVAVESLAGRKLADIIPSLNEGVDAVSPCRRLFLNQPSLEPILRDRAREAGATIIQGAEVTALRQHAQGVEVRMKDIETGMERVAHGKYLIAADGAHSTVRELLGIKYEGRGAFSNSITIYFTADLSPWLGDKAWSIIYVNNPVLRGFFRMNRNAQTGFLAVNTVGDPMRDPEAAANAAADISEARLIQLVRAGVGVEDLPLQIHGIGRWRASALVAQRFRDDRIFITGDAAHLMPPNGGFGGNTGIHDAHNLAWKIALVLKGHANEKLLHTYESERRPVAAFTVEQAFSRYVARTAPWLQSRHHTEPLAHDFDIELGYLYGGARTHADPRETRGMPAHERRTCGCCAMASVSRRSISRATICSSRARMAGRGSKQHAARASHSADWFWTRAAWVATLSISKDVLPPGSDFPRPARRSCGPMDSSPGAARARWPDLTKRFGRRWGEASASDEGVVIEGYGAAAGQECAAGAAGSVDATSAPHAGPRH